MTEPSLKKKKRKRLFIYLFLAFSEKGTILKVKLSEDNGGIHVLSVVKRNFSVQTPILLQLFK